MRYERVSHKLRCGRPSAWICKQPNKLWLKPKSILGIHVPTKACNDARKINHSQWWYQTLLGPKLHSIHHHRMLGNSNHHVAIMQTTERHLDQCAWLATKATATKCMIDWVLVFVERASSFVSMHMCMAASSCVEAICVCMECGTMFHAMHKSYVFSAASRNIWHMHT